MTVATKRQRKRERARKRADARKTWFVELVLSGVSKETAKEVLGAGNHSYSKARYEQLKFFIGRTN